MFTLCIPTYNRAEMVLESFKEVIEDPRISEIIINDDNSEIEVYQEIVNKISIINNGKIKIFRNEINLKAFQNKRECISKSSNEWVILLDSDNRLTKEYLDSIPQTLEDNYFYLPSRAICDSQYLDYSQFSNVTINKDLYKDFVRRKDAKTECLLNTGNYLVNKRTYLKAIEFENNLIESLAVDAFYTIYLCFRHIENFHLKVVEGMVYYHRLHKDSYYLAYSAESEVIKQMLVEKIDF